MLIPVGLTALPTKIEEVQFFNTTGGFTGDVSTIDNLEKNLKLIKKNVSSLTKHYFRIKTNQFFSYMFSEFVSIISSDKPCFDVVVSNIPGFEIPLKIAGSVGSSVFPIASCGNAMMFAPCASYNGKMTMIFCIESSTEINAIEFAKIVDETMKEQLKLIN